MLDHVAQHVGAGSACMQALQNILPSAELFREDQHLFPVLEGDNLLQLLLEEDEEDERVLPGSSSTEMQRDKVGDSFFSSCASPVSQLPSMLLTGVDETFV